MKQDMYWVIFNSNVMESTEYVQEFMNVPIFFAGFIYLAVGLCCLFKSVSGTKTSIPIRKSYFIFCLSILIVLTDISLQYLSQAIPTIEFYKSFLLFKRENYLFEQERELRNRLTAEVQCALPDSEEHVFVILLGESATTFHMSLYGYSRQTTPLMDARRHELDVFTDVVTPDTHTYGVMQKVLTFANHAHPEYYRNKASVVELFNAAGFETYWIANNPILDKWGASYGVIAEEATQLFDVSPSQKPDGIVLKNLKEIVDDDSTRNKVIFIHLMGNHHTYKTRYTEEFERFDYASDGDMLDLGFRTNEMKETIDQYDNSILYGDFVYNSILNELEKTGQSAYLLFFSDHGEEVFDTRNASGHFMANVYPCQCRIPFVLWRSEKYMAENPDIVIDTARPYSIEDVIYSISTLSRLKYKDNDQTLSVFSPTYKAPGSRFVGNENYEDILKKVAK
jgi:heptose-I-phosphate ethanolaminephosphotransferase